MPLQPAFFLTGVAEYVGSFRSARRFVLRGRSDEPHVGTPAYEEDYCYKTATCGEDRNAEFRYVLRVSKRSRYTCMPCLIHTVVLIFPRSIPPDPYSGHCTHNELPSPTTTNSPCRKDIIRNVPFCVSDHPECIPLPRWNWRRGGVDDSAARRRDGVKQQYRGGRLRHMAQR